MIGITCPWCERDILLALAELTADTICCPTCRTRMDLAPCVALDDAVAVEVLPLAA